MYELIDKCAQQIDTFLMKEIEKQKADGRKGSFFIYYLCLN